VYNAVSPHCHRLWTAHFPTTIRVRSRYLADDSPSFIGTLDDFSYTPESKMAYLFFTLT